MRYAGRRQKSSILVPCGARAVLIRRCQIIIVNIIAAQIVWIQDVASVAPPDRLRMPLRANGGGARGSALSRRPGAESVIEEQESTILQNRKNGKSVYPLARIVSLYVQTVGVFAGVRERIDQVRCI